MRPQLALFAALGSVSVHMVAGQDASATAAIEQTLSAVLPDCAVTCWLSAVPESTCSVMDSACICANANLTAAISTCSSQMCTIREGLVALRYWKTSCGAPVRNQIVELTVVNYFLLASSIAAVAIRVATRTPWMNGKWDFCWDDWFVLSCLGALIAASLISNIVLVFQAGLGQDIWMLEPEQITKFLQYFFVEELLYAWVICFTKVAMSCFYRRVFLPDPGPAKFRLGCDILLYSSMLFFLEQTLWVILLCRPISYMWTSWDGEHLEAGICDARGVQAYVNGGINIVLDLFAFALPIPRLYTLNMNWRRKTLLIGMFLTGFFVTACSVVRIEQITEYANTQNISWDYVGLSIWSLAEMHASVIIVCMPSMAKFVQRCYVRLAHMTARSPSTNHLTNPQPPGRDGTLASDMRRGPLTRMLDALDNMTTSVRTGRTTGRQGSISSQKSLTRMTTTTLTTQSGTESRQDAPISRDLNSGRSTVEYTDYAKFYKEYEKKRKSQSMEMQAMETRNRRQDS